MDKKKPTKGRQTTIKGTANSTGNKIEHSKAEKVEAANKEKEANETDCNPHKIINYQKGDDGMKIWNKLSVIFNGVMAAVTVGLIWYNIKGINAATKSANIADSTLNEVKRQFEVINRPILQIGDIVFKNFKPGENPVLNCKIENVGNFAAKVLTRKIKVGYVHDISERGKDSGWVRLEIPTYVTKETPFTENFFINEILEKEYYEATIKSILKILVIGEVEYINEVTKENWLFEFAIEIKPPPSKDFTIRVANNKLIK